MSDMVKQILAILTIATMVIGATLFVAAKPDRAEVKSIIDDKVGYRLTVMEKQLEKIDAKLDSLNKRLQ